MNRIAKMRTAELVALADSRTIFMVFLTVELRDLVNADEFIAEVAKNFLIQRFISPVETDHLLITLHSPLTAEYFAKVWRRLAETDSLLAHDMRTFRVANVVRGTPEGVITETVSLLNPPEDVANHPITQPPNQP